MIKKSLKYLPKDELIEIIVSDKFLERKAFDKLIETVHKKIMSIRGQICAGDIEGFHKGLKRILAERKKNG